VPERTPRETFITVYGRKPVLEVLGDPGLDVDKIVLATNARDRSADDIVRAAAERGVRVAREPATFVTQLSRNGRHDQGVVADVRAAGLTSLDAALEALRPPSTAASTMLVLDGITNPANVGMVLRTATAGRRRRRGAAPARHGRPRAARHQGVGGGRRSARRSCARRPSSMRSRRCRPPASPCSASTRAARRRSSRRRSPSAARSCWATRARA
jgi:hypothetical protein